MRTVAQQVAMKLILASVAILGTLAIVRVCGYFLVAQRVDGARTATDLSRRVSDQLHLNHLFALAVEQGDLDRDQFGEELYDFKEAHQKMRSVELSDKDLERRINALDTTVAHIVTAGNNYLDGNNAGDLQAARIELLKYAATYEAVVKDIPDELNRLADEELKASQRIQLVMLVTVLACLAISIGIVAGPLRASLVSTLNDLETAQKSDSERADELETLRHELERANRELSDRHVRLRKAYDESAATNKFLLMASARFEDLFHGVPFPCFSVDDEGTVFEWNESATRMFGVAGHEMIQKSLFKRFFSKEGDHLLGNMIAQAFRGQHLTNIEMEAQSVDGPRRLLVSVFPLKASRKEPTAALIACADITLQKDAEQRAKVANEKVGAILDSIQDAFVSLDRNLVYRYVNNTAAAWLGHLPSEIIGKPLADAWPGISDTGFFKEVARLVESREAASFEQYIENKDMWLEFRVYPSEEGVSIFYNDVTSRKANEETIQRQQSQLEDAMLRLNENSALLEQKQFELQEANRNLHQLATTDGLTGLLNHRAMQDELLKASKRSTAHGKPVAVALLDVDHFKKFNDSFGHQAGDEVLRKVAHILKDSVREGDIVARYGGEEFCVILPETTEIEAIAVCERIRANVEDAAWEQRQVTVSVGLSTSYSVTDTQEFLKQSDKSLYDAKAGGRNKVCVFKDETYRCA